MSALFFCHQNYCRFTWVQVELEEAIGHMQVSKELVFCFPNMTLASSIYQMAWTPEVYLVKYTLDHVDIHCKITSIEGNLSSYGSAENLELLESTLSLLKL